MLSQIYKIEEMQRVGALREENELCKAAEVPKFYFGLSGSTDQRWSRGRSGLRSEFAFCVGARSGVTAVGLPRSRPTFLTCLFTRLDQTNGP